MGLSSFFASFRGSKPKDSTPPPSSTRQDRPKVAASPATRRTRREVVAGASSSQPKTALPSSPSSVAMSSSGNETKEERKSGGVALSGPKSQHGSKNRRSWFGGKPDDEEDLPAVPKLAYTRGRQQSDKAQINVDVQSMEPQPRRSSMGRSLSKKKANSQDQPQSRRRSWFSANQAPTTRIEALPPLPPMPVTIIQSQQHTTPTLPAEKRPSRAGSIKSGRKSRSFWSSSNPDDSDPDIPPVPALDRDISPGGSESSGSSVNNDSAPRTSAKQPRPLTAGTRKTYVPKSAAKGFLKSTNGASEKTRQSYRRSFKIDDDADLVCLTEEQQIEWARLMNEASKLESRTPRQDLGQVESIDKKLNGKKFSNAQALAALEFGLRT